MIFDRCVILKSEVVNSSHVFLLWCQKSNFFNTKRKARPSEEYIFFFSLIESEQLSRRTFFSYLSSRYVRYERLPFKINFARLSLIILGMQKLFLPVTKRAFLSCRQYWRIWQFGGEKYLVSTDGEFLSWGRGGRSLVSVSRDSSRRGSQSTEK